MFFYICEKLMMTHKWYFLEISLLLIIVSYIFYVFAVQKQIQRENGFGWDGVFYNAMYQKFKGNGEELYKSKDSLYNKTYNDLTKEDPFNKRIAVPFIASKMPFSEVSSFKIINLIGFFSGLILLFIKWSKESLIITLIFSFYIIVTPQIAFKGAVFYPVYVDGAQFFFLSLMVYFFDNPKYIFFISILFLPFKETAVPLSCIYFGCRILWERSLKYLTYIVLSLLVYLFYLKFLSSYLDIPSQSNSLKVLKNYMKYYFTDFRNLIRMAACFFMAFSYFVFVKRKFTVKTLFFICLVSLLALSGSDTTRIFLIALPFLLDELVETKQNNNVILYGAMLLFSLPYKFVFTELKFNDFNKVGEGFFITNLEYRPLSESLFFLLYFLVSSIVLLLLKNILKKGYIKITHTNIIR